MASNLHNKINSYAIEKGIEFGNGTAWPEVETGSLAQSLSNQWVLTSSISTTSTDSPVGGDNSRYWNFSTPRRERLTEASGASWISALKDHDYSMGFWFKVNSWTYTPGTSTVLFGSTPVTNNGFTVSINSNAAGFPEYDVMVISYNQSPTFSIIQFNDPNLVSPDAIPTDVWHYFAAVRNGSTMDIYINGQFKTTITGFGTSTGPTTALFGHNGIVGTGPVYRSYNMSNFYIAPRTTIGATQISEIYAVGSPTITNISVAATPLTASSELVGSTIITQAIISATPITATALQTEPTIAVTIGDHTEITTSITASAVLPTNIAVYAVKNINITISETLNASLIFGDNIIINAGTDESFSAAQFTATAELIGPILPELPMTANVTMPNATVYVTPNYYSLVKSENPYLYYYDGGSAYNGATPAVNGGYQTGTLTRGTQTLVLQDSGNPMQIVGNGKSWRTASTSNAQNWFRFNSPDLATSFSQVLKTGQYSVEMWINTSNAFQFNTYNNFTHLGNNIYEMKNIWFDSEGLTFGPYSLYNANSGYSNGGFYMTVKTGPTTTQTFNGGYNSIIANNWQQVVVRSYITSGSNRQIELWQNGSIILSGTYSMSSWTPTSTEVQLGANDDGNSAGGIYQSYLDEWALYPTVLANSDIATHYNFISTLSPNVTFTAPLLSADVEIKDSQVLAIDNAILTGDFVTATALIVNPTIIAQKTINFAASALNASAQNTDVTVYYGWTIYETPAIAYAEKPSTYFLNDLYYQHVQANIAPYRYLTFDSANAALDYGTDTDYSVVNAVINGTVVNPDLGINGKSVKSTGTYTNGAVVLKESEHSDNWGTGNASWHSSFWMQRAIDDTSTGLRVLWNVNGYADNQHIIIYHYQNKLHVQINDQNDAPITMSTANNIDVFDFNRHHIVLNSHHNNNQNTLTLYVDGAQVATQNIGTYAITTINGTPHTAPNDEVNNLPRLGVGTLITPFGFTSLPVVPTNISVYFDEIYWDKNQITLSGVVSQFNAMPDKNNKTIIVEAFIASDEFVMPAFSTSSVLATSPLIASASLVQPQITADRELITAATVLTATAELRDAQRIDNVNIVSDIFVATATFNDAGVRITIPGGPMTLSAILPGAIKIKIGFGSFGESVTDLESATNYSQYVKYLISDSVIRAIPRMVEVK